MQKNELHFVVVCGYGCNIESPLAGYLDRVADFLSRRHAEFVILCGGETQKIKYPGKSEASVMSDYLSQFSRTWLTLTAFAWEDDSYTTFDNIRLAAAKIRRIKSQHEEAGTKTKFKITIFCETQRALKVILLSRHFMPDLVDDVDDIRVETYNWERGNPNRELWTTVKTRLAIKFPGLGLAERERRRRIHRSFEI